LLHVTVGGVILLPSVPSLGTDPQLSVTGGVAIVTPEQEAFRPQQAFVATGRSAVPIRFLVLAVTSTLL
jgi:hypothetical protein